MDDGPWAPVSAINPTVAEFLYRKHFKIVTQVEADRTGLLIHVVFMNERPHGTGATPDVEVWLPIDGYVAYRGSDQLTPTFMMEKIYELGDVPGYAERDLQIKVGKNVSFAFHSRVNLSDAAEMKEISEKYGVVQLSLHLSFAALYNAGGAGQKTFGYHPVFRFAIPKATIVEWLAHWASWHAKVSGLPQRTPAAVSEDFAEAISALDVNASKASVAMARRALQVALEDKGAAKGGRLIDQVEELEKNGLIDGAAAHLANGVRMFGNFGAHPQDDMLSKVSPDDARLVLDVTKKIIGDLYNSQGQM